VAGLPVEGSKIVIGSAGIFTISGSVRFTKMPNQSIDVEIQRAAVAISVPIDGTLTELLELRGNARFTFGGATGFQLQNFFVNGFSVFGQNVATLTSPATQLRAPTAELYTPLASTRQDIALLNDADDRFIYVYYRDVNLAGFDVATITDDAAEFTLLGAAAAGVTVNGRAIQVDPNNPNLFKYAYTGNFVIPPANPSDPYNTVTVNFVAGTFRDARGAVNTEEAETFNVFSGAAATPLVPAPTLASPTNGATMNLRSFMARPYIDVTFAAGSGGKVEDASINGDELRLTGAAAANFQLGPGGVPLLDSTQAPSGVLKLNANTWRFFLKPRVGTPAAPVVFVAGALNVEIAATVFNTTNPAWRVEDTNSAGAGLGTFRNGSPGTGAFTLTAAADGATGSGNVAIGPLFFSLPTFSLVDTKFKDGALTLTIGIEVAEAGLAFGAPAASTTGPSAQQQSSGMGARLTGILGTFDVKVDLLRAVQGLTNPSELLAAFSVPGKWGLSVAGLEVLVPDVLRITGSNIKINYDPNAAASVPIVTVASASIEFPTFGITGSIMGLAIRRNGFDLGSFEIKYRPGGTGNTGQGPQTIRFGSILELDDIRIGVTNFSVTFGQAIDFSGTIYIASGGVKLMPGSAFNATITDREGIETGTLLPGQAADNTEAVRAALEFENGRVKAFLFKADTMRVQLGSFVTLTAKDFFLDTGADATEELVSFTSLGAEVTVGGMKIGGEGRNFAFMGDGSFRAKPGFGVFLSVGSSDASGFKWPAWLPVKINAIGIEWRDIQNDPSDFVITLSVSVTEIKGIGGLTFSGSIEGVKIDVGKLLAGQFPIVDIASIGVQVKGTLFGGKIDAALIGGILKLNASGQIIDPTDSTTPVADRVLFFGLEGKFEFSGIGVGIRLALSELGPLTVQLSASLPTGIMLIPQIGLVMNDFTAGVEFFKTLPSIDQPEELRKPDFQAPGGMSVDQWLSTVKQQVAAQYRAIKANPSMNGFAAAFTAPMTITGSAKIYSLYTSKQVFNGQVTIKFSTDGKILIIGTLNF
ncbi:MAG: hypothetical protein ACYC1P_13960, partial [Gaiellaceae bacterium]